MRSSKNVPVTSRELEPSEITSYLDTLFDVPWEIARERDNADQTICTVRGTSYVIQRTYFSAYEFMIRGRYVPKGPIKEGECYSYDELSETELAMAQIAIYKNIETCSNLQFALSDDIESIEKRFEE